MRYARIMLALGAIGLLISTSHADNVTPGKVEVASLGGIAQLNASTAITIESYKLAKLRNEGDKPTPEQLRTQDRIHWFWELNEDVDLYRGESIFHRHIWHYSTYADEDWAMWHIQRYDAPIWEFVNDPITGEPLRCIVGGIEFQDRNGVAGPFARNSPKLILALELRF